MRKAVWGKLAEDEPVRTACCRPIDGRVVGLLQTVSCLEMWNSTLSSVTLVSQAWVLA